tara:strand:- start:65 stop:1204 length:1140 start_codon:yes stop_codon:yes gene_type:complete
MYKEISSFIDPAIELEIGKDKWGTFKEYELNFDSNPLIITSKSCRKFISDIDSELIIEVNSEPSFETINESYKKISKKLPNLINKENIFFIALGGGSVIDTAKIICLMISNNINSVHNLINNESTKKFSEKIKIICIPTTSGTGAEITPFSSIWDKKNGLKYSIVADKLFRKIILDPKLTLGLPKKIIISSGIDALCQILESSWSNKSNKLSLKSSFLGYRFFSKNINLILKDLNNIKLREEMLISSFLSGISISTANTTLCHSISYPLTAILNIPHGLACGFSLVEVIKFNSKSNDMFLKNTLDITKCKNSEMLIRKISDILTNIEFKSLISQYLSVIEKNIDNLLPLTLNSRSSNNPVRASLNDVETIIKNSLDSYK